MVEEVLPFTLSGSGEHLWVQLRKRQLTTGEAVRKLAKWAGVQRRAVSFAGQKDKHAVTTQWFSIHLPGKPDPEQAWRDADGEILALQRHTQKLRRGALQGNCFVITVRDCGGNVEALEERVKQIRQTGVPNYFGEQRFGRDGKNVVRALEWFAGRYRPKGREHRAMLLSAARSRIFNQVLAERVRQGIWNRAVPGDLLMLSGSHSFFLHNAADQDIPVRIVSGDLSPTGPLYGRGDIGIAADAEKLESVVLAQEKELADGLLQAGLKPARRSLRMMPKDLTLEWQDAATMRLSFTLPPGCYATVLLRELVDYQDVSHS